MAEAIRGIEGGHFGHWQILDRETPQILLNFISLVLQIFSSPSVTFVGWLSLTLILLKHPEILRLLFGCCGKDDREEIKTPIEVLNNPESSEQISSPAEASNKSESSELKTPSSSGALSGPESAEKEMSSPAEASNTHDSEKKTATPAEASNEPDLSGKKTASPAEASKKPDLAEKKTALPAEASNSGKKTPRSLKGKAKIVKKSPIRNSLKTSKGAGSSQANGRKFRGNNENSDKREEDSKKLNSRKENQQSIMKGQHTEKSHQAQKNPGKIEKLEKSQQKQKSTEKRRGLDKSLKSQKSSEKHDEKKEKLGGLIFMCNGKTKPDCFHYRIMGVSMAKKDLVSGIKPGLKLFLYDFDLKLLYGVYKASSSGGLKLEPKAFGGAFPAQVRFNVEKDCLPLPESVFKKAIKENYNEQNKFKTELTVRQVRKLAALFRPAQVHSTALAPGSPLKSKVRDREVHEGVRKSLPLSHRDARTRDPYSNGDARSYPVLAHERDQHVAYRDPVSVRREETSHDLYLTEKEYRAYGLRGERRIVATDLITPPAVEARHRQSEREKLLRQPNVMYREAVPAHRENFHSDPPYLNDKDYPAYALGARHELPPATSATAVDVYARDPYYRNSYYGASSLDPYLAPQRREEIVHSGSHLVGGRREYYLIETDPVQRRETTNRIRENYLAEADPVQRRETDHRVERLSLYSGHAAAAADAQLRYNRTEDYHASKPEAVHAPVSSRYAFAGPSYSYR